MKPLPATIFISIILMFPQQSYAQWTEVTTGLTGAFGVRALVVSGSDLFAGTAAGVFRSTDSGISWTPASLGIPSTSDISVIVVSGTNLFAGTTEKGIFRSTNNGATWTSVNNGFTNTAYVSALAVIGTMLYAATYDGVFRSSDNGSSWISSGTGLPTGAYITSIAVLGTTVYASGSLGVYRSTDGGTSWSNISVGLPQYFFGWCLLVSGPNLFVGGIDRGVFLSTDGGTTWMSRGNELASVNVNALAVSGTNLFAATSSPSGVHPLGTIFRSTNNGTSWTVTSAGITNSFFSCFAFVGGYMIVGLQTDAGPTMTAGVLRRPFYDWMPIDAPSDGIGGITLPLVLRWRAHPKALGYTLRIWSNEISFFVSSYTTDTTLTVSDLKLGTAYLWEVRGENIDWASDWGGGSFTTKLQSAPQLVSPATGDLSVSTTPTLSWTSLASTATYTVQVSTTPTFDITEYSKVTSASTFVSSLLAPSTFYHWRVRAHTRGDTTEWSSPSFFRTVPIVPSAITLSYPDSSRQDVYENDWLQWQSNAAATAYTVQISASPQFSIVFDSCTVTSTGYRNPNRKFTSGTTYFWRVRGSNSGGIGEFSSVWPFKVGSALRTPVTAYVPTGIGFRKVKVGSYLDQSLTISNLGTDTLKVTSMIPSSQMLGVNPVTATVAPDTSTVITVRFAPITGGPVSATLTILGNQHSSSDVINLTGFGATYLLRTSARAIDFGKVRVGQTRDTVLTLSNIGTDTLQISDIGTEGSSFELRTSVPMIPPGGVVSDSVRFRASNAGVLKGNVIIKSNGSSSPDTVMLAGFGLTYGLKLSASRLDIGLVLVGKSKDTTFTLTNLGNDTLRVTGISTKVSGVSVRPTIFNLLPSGSIVDTIRFTPTSVGAFAGTLVISSNLPASPDSLAITASGVTATADVLMVGGVPTEFRLGQNYPNPFNPSTKISYALPERSAVGITVYNLLGNVVYHAPRQVREAGYYEQTFDASQLPSGIYMYRMTAISEQSPGKQFVASRKMVLVK